MRSWLLLAAALLVGWSADARSANLVAVVSERNAADMARTAHTFHQRHPQHRLTFRTTAQIEALSDVEIQRLIAGADALLLVTVFKDTAQRFSSLLGQSRASEVIAVAGDPALGRLSRWRGRRLFADNDPRYDELSSLSTEKDASAASVSQALRSHPKLAPWIRARGYWQNRGEENLLSLLALMLSEQDRRLASHVQPILDTSTLRLRHGTRTYRPEDFRIETRRKVVALLDDQHSDGRHSAEVGAAICRDLTARNLECVTVMAGWGKPGRDALEILRTRVGNQLGAIVSVQDFVVGGSSHSAAATRLFEQLDVPVFKGIRLHDVSPQAWRLSGEGLSWDSVYYRVSMPELQGISQPIVIAASAVAQVDSLTGIEVSRILPIEPQIAVLTERVARWIRLQETANASKRIAIVYYNHPPGRHNIGADNLDVPASLLEILRALKREGYNTGTLPETPEALLALLQRDGVNLPEQADALGVMAKRVTTVSSERYAQWFANAPAALQSEMLDGPLARLQAGVEAAQAARLPQEARVHVTRTLQELEHLVEGVQHPARSRALDLLHQLSQAYESAIAKGSVDERVASLSRALRDTAIEGLRGWGKIPGSVMVDNGELVLPGLRFGNIFVGPQPPRGWELNEELLHANTSIPPTHQYLGFYFWLRNEFKADAIVHLGRHSTYEFLPRKSVGLDENDYPALIAGGIPGIYPYIVDGVGEGLQAKRRGLAVMIDHLIPPLATTPLYDDLLRLRQLVESYESAGNPALRRQAVATMRSLIDELNLRDALVASMDAELKVRGISFEQADDELLVHEIGHYLTRLQEDFMPLGLHVFGKPWSAQAVDTMLKSIQSGGNSPIDGMRRKLVDSPSLEMRALLHALSGRFVPAGPGNDPIRNPTALPTGRNFHGLDNSLLPSQLGYTLGQQLAIHARERVTPEGKEAVILWASDSVRDEGAMVGFGLALLGVAPQWNSRGIVSGLKRKPLNEVKVRADTVFITSGLFRDLFGQQIVWLDKAVLLALDGSRHTIERDHPQLREALTAALEPLGTLADSGSELLSRNYVAQHWVTEATTLLRTGLPAAHAGAQAALRVFGTSPGDYGAGINRLVERSGSWNDRSAVAQVYLDRIGHAYSADGRSAPRYELLKSNLRSVHNTYLGRSSNLYGLLDNNDAFDYLGGLSLAVETVSGRVPASFVVDHSNASKPKMQPLPAALVTELRGRYLNPAWITPLMQHGYAGARTMGSEFTEYLWGWQITNPDIIRSWAWDEVKSVYLDDRHQLGLDEFLEQGANVHVKTNMMAILLVAAEKNFWQADEATLRQLSRQWVDLLLKHGLPGSGHTRPDHPVFEWVVRYLREDQREPLEQMLARAYIAAEKAPASPSTLTELQQADETSSFATVTSEKSGTAGGWSTWLVTAVIAILVGTGFLRGRRGLNV